MSSRAGVAVGCAVGSGVGAGSLVGAGMGVDVGAGVAVGTGEGEGAGGGVGIVVGTGAGADVAVACASVGTGAGSGSLSPQAVNPISSRQRRPTATAMAFTPASADVSVREVELRPARQRKLGRRSLINIATPIIVDTFWVGSADSALYSYSTWYRSRCSRSTSFAKSFSTSRQTEWMWFAPFCLLSNSTTKLPP